MKERVTIFLKASKKTVLSENRKGVFSPFWDDWLMAQGAIH
jgi:hypothetical protein